MFQMFIILTSFKHVGTCLKEGAIRHNYCTTFSKQIGTYLLDDVIKPNCCIIGWAGQGWTGRDWAGLAWFELFKKMMQSSKVIASLGLGWPGPTN